MFSFFPECFSEFMECILLKCRKNTTKWQRLAFPSTVSLCVVRASNHLLSRSETIENQKYSLRSVHKDSTKLWNLERFYTQWNRQRLPLFSGRGGGFMQN